MASHWRKHPQKVSWQQIWSFKILNLQLNGNFGDVITPITIDDVVDAVMYALLLKWAILILLIQNGGANIRPK